MKKNKTKGNCDLQLWLFSCNSKFIPLCNTHTHTHTHTSNSKSLEFIFQMPE